MSDVSNPNSYQSAVPLYYRHSGKFSVTGWILAAIIASLVTIPLSIGYTYATLYMPYIGRFTFLFTALYAWLLCLIITFALKSAKTRNMLMAFLAAMVITTFALVTAWYMFVFAMLPHLGIHHVGIFDLIADPGLMKEKIALINATGVRKVRGHVDTGAALTALWIAEAATIYIIAVGLSLFNLSRLTFCEKCNKWGITKALGKLAPADDKAMKSELERHDFSTLQKLGPPPTSTEWYALTLEGCPDCDTTQALTIDRTSITYDKKNKETKKESNVIRRLMLSPEELVFVAQAVAEASASNPAEPPAESK